MLTNGARDAYHYAPLRAAEPTLPRPLGYLVSYTNSGTGLVVLGAR